MTVVNPYGSFYNSALASGYGLTSGLTTTVSSSTDSATGLTTTVTQADILARNPYRAQADIQTAAAANATEVVLSYEAQRVYDRLSENFKQTQLNYAAVTNTAVGSAAGMSSMTLLGIMYLNGEGAEQDIAKGFRYLVQSAGQGDVTAQLQLAQEFESGERLTKDLEAAANWYSRAILQGTPQAFEAFENVLRGDSTILIDKPSMLTALNTLHGEGNSIATQALGRLIKDSSASDKNIEEVVKLFTRAANQGDPEALRDLGKLYASGDTVDQDITTARRWFSRYVDTVGGGGYANLVRDFTNGNGVPVDYSEANYWSLLGRSAGYNV